MDTEIFAMLNKWAATESRHYAAKDDDETESLALQLSSIEDNILRLRPATKIGALVQLQFVAGHLERSGDDRLLSGTLRHVLYTLSRA